jgi:hypothetical protein
MKEVLSVFTCGFGALCFAPFVAVLNPNAVSVVAGRANTSMAKRIFRQSAIGLVRGQLRLGKIPIADDPVDWTKFHPPRSRKVDLAPGMGQTSCQANRAVVFGYSNVTSHKTCGKTK